MNQLRKIRQDAGFSRREIAAEKLGIHLDTLGRYERGETKPTSEEIVKMAQLYGVDPNTLLGWQTA